MDLEKDSGSKDKWNRQRKKKGRRRTEGWSEKGGMQRADASARRRSAELGAAAHSCVTTPQILSFRLATDLTCQKQSHNFTVP